METPTQHTCINCKGHFYEWNYEYDCKHCDDGTAETIRDIDFNGTGYHTCNICKGTGAESQTETEFCCEDCINEYSHNNY